MPELSFLLKMIVSPPFGENTYLVHRRERDDCLVIDPGFDVDSIVDYLEQRRLRPAAILNTHGHVDHFAGNAGVKQLWPECPVVIGRGDAPKLTDAGLNLSSSFGFSFVSAAADVLVDGGQVVEWAGFTLEVREIPGHSSGHVVFILRTEEPPVVFAGDTLFAGGVGRSDFPGGDGELLAAGIRQHLFTLPDDTIVYPGHGPATTVGVERRTNPWVGDGA
ncbi:MAG: MBL fold metallo-hydrolase [Planctomycetes bacterium]|nr:MBL fold metallo-hydrolase [Planctomycetota bacterium]